MSLLFCFDGRVPSGCPAPGLVLYHNHIRHRPNAHSGTNGFRVWVATREKGVALCPCGWRSDLGKHYARRSYAAFARRAKRNSPAASR